MLKKLSTFAVILITCASFNLYAGFLDDVNDIVGVVADGLGPKFGNVFLTDKVQDNKPVGNKRVFSSDTPKIYLFVGVENINSNSPVTASYYYQKNGDWENIGNFSTKIPINMNIAYFYVDKPESMMWPLGNYKIEIQYQNQIYKTINFSMFDNSSNTTAKPNQLKFTDSSLGLEIDYPSTMNISRNGNIVTLVNRDDGNIILIKQLKDEQTQEEIVAETTSQESQNSSSIEDDFSF